jgi:hypothetical protein
MDKFLCGWIGDAIPRRFQQNYSGQQTTGKFDILPGQ